MRDFFYVLRRDDRYMASDAERRTTPNAMDMATLRYKLTAQAKIAQSEHPDFEIVRVTVFVQEETLRSRPSARRMAP